MIKEQGKIPCYGFGALTHNIPGTPHRYIGASKGCWNIYEKVLEKEYGQDRLSQLINRLTINAYALQHPGIQGRQTIQSVNIHLLSLHYFLVKNYKTQETTKSLTELMAKNPAFEWLEPPKPNGNFTVLDIANATSKKEHEMKVRQWAEDIWECWYAKHSTTIEKLVKDYIALPAE